MSDTFRTSGKRHELPASPSAWRFVRRPGGWLIAERATESGGVERRRLMLWSAGTKLAASLRGNLWSGEISANERAARGGGQGSDADLIAQFPGKVRKLLVKSGDVVKEGDGLVLVEAMKMEFAVKAPYAGTVKKVHVVEGQQLSPGDRFVDLETSEARNG